jgi:hypothetical protein
VGGGVGSNAGGEYASDRGFNGGAANWGNPGVGVGSNFVGSSAYGGSSSTFNPNALSNYNSSSYGAASNPSGLGFNANATAFSLSSNNLSSSLAQLHPYGVGVAGLNALGGGGVGVGGLGANNATALAGLNAYAGFGAAAGNYGGVQNAFSLGGGAAGGLGSGQNSQNNSQHNTLNAGLYDPANSNLRMF